MAQPPQACAPCPAHYAVLQGAYARYTNTLIVLERALYLAHANARTLLVDTQAMFPNNSKITQKYNPGTRSLADILQVEPFRAACICIDDVSTVPSRRCSTGRRCRARHAACRRREPHSGRRATRRRRTSAAW